MKGSFDNICIKGITAAVPDNKFDNVEFAKNEGTKRHLKQIRLTGVRERRVVKNGQKASDLAILSAQELMESLGWSPDSISVIIFVTQSADLVRPSTAFLIQSALSINEDCLVFDINMGCAGYTSGLVAICGILQSCKGRGLLLVGESNAGTYIQDGGYLLEGDAASATALEYSGKAERIYYDCKSDGSRANLIYKPFNKSSFMDGNAILLFGLNEVATSIREYISSRKETYDIDYYVFHQAQKLIVEGVAEEAGVDKNKMLLSCELFGNTSSASIPLSIVVNSDRFEGERKRLLLCGFGIGLAWDIVEVTIDSNALFPLIESNYICKKNEKIRKGDLL